MGLRQIPRASAHWVTQFGHHFNTTFKFSLFHVVLSLPGSLGNVNKLHMARLQIAWQSSVKLTPKARLWVTQAAEIAAHELPAKAKTVLLSINICGDAKMRGINRTHRNKDKTTDVLSFPAQITLRKTSQLDWAGPGILPLGDLIISLPQAQRQAKEFKISLEEELVHLFFHGFLHLCGYDHEVSPQEEKIMEKEEARLLEKFAQNKKPRKSGAS